MSEPTPPATPWHIRVQRVALRCIGLLIVRMVYRIRTVHANRIPASGGALLLPNHVTFADAFMISAACPRPVRFVMDDAPLKHAPVRWFCSIFNTVNIRRGQSREALRLTVEAVNQGDVVCYFAEGQLSRTGTLQELKRGVELIAGKLQAPLVPMWTDGAWGSVFSFERNRFFGKKSYRLPHRLFVAFGEPIAPSDATVKTLRQRLLELASDAIRLRMPDENPVALNGHQIGQINALPWQRPFAVLNGDKLATSLSEGFSEEFGAQAVGHQSISGPLSRWVGGEALRKRIEETQIHHPIDFFDFSDQALEPLEKENVRHLPCLAIDGLVISMSIPDPSVPRNANFQVGGKPGTWGLLLPGWYIEDSVVKGPAAPQGIPLPAGAFADEEGFLHAKAD